MATKRQCNDCGSKSWSVVGYGANDDGKKPFKIRACDKCRSTDLEKIR